MAILTGTSVALSNFVRTLLLSDATKGSGKLLTRATDDAKLETKMMMKDDRNILVTLKQELDFIEKGGYGRSVKTPWKATSAFQDSLTCLNHADPEKTRLCNECFLIDFVPTMSCAEAVPCHHIPLNDAGDSIETLEEEGNQQKLEASLKGWLNVKIRDLEESGAIH